jgi:adenosylcobinamide hydrolase
MNDSHWETLPSPLAVHIRRRGRFLVVDLKTPHLTISTSARNGGQVDHVRHLVNHQSCEGAGHASRSQVIAEGGPEQYHDRVCAEINLPPDETTTMGTAANMNYAAIATEVDAGVQVTAVVTAGVQTNAVCAGDPASWRETEEGIVKVASMAGTINTMLIASAPLTAAALARMVVTMTEAKSAALQRLAVPSCYSADLATGTGTDQYCVTAPLQGGRPLTSASPHLKLGEITGRAVRQATLEALRWQNGLEASYTRSLFHALGRYGIREQSIFQDLAPLLEPADMELLRKNSQAVFYEPLVAAAAHALAAVVDRVRHGTLPASATAEAMVQQAASLAACLAARPDRWSSFRAQLQGQVAEGTRPLVLAAIALGWSEKWRAD